MVESFQPYTDADLTLVVDGNTLCVNKDIITRESPVKFVAMLEESCFMENEQQLELTPPQDITHDDIVQILNCVNPELNQPMTGKILCVYCSGFHDRY